MQKYKRISNDYFKNLCNKKPVACVYSELQRYSLKYLSLSVLSVLISSGNAFCGGYEIVGHSQEGTGLAYVGAAAGYSDGSAAHYNPAAISIIDQETLSVGGHLVSTRNKFVDQGSNVLGLTNRGSSKPIGESFDLVPDLYYISPLANDLTLGISLTSPFGLGSHFKDDWVGRYQTIESTLMTAKLGAALSYDLMPNFSVGAGVSAIYAKADLENAIDFGTIATSILGADALAFGLAPQSADGKFKAKADDLALGYNVGALYRYGDNNNSRIGLTYRAKTILDLEGDSSYEIPEAAAFLNSTGAFDKSDLSARTTLPEAISLGLIHQLSKEWSILAESTWTRWTRFDVLSLKFDHPSQSPASEYHNWNNTWRHGLALAYAPIDSAWRFRLGFMYDASTIPDAEHRSPVAPVSDEYDLALGTSYSLCDNIVIHAGYLRAFFKDGESNRAGATGDTLVGEWDNNSIDILSAGMTYSF